MNGVLASLYPIAQGGGSGTTYNGDNLLVTDPTQPSDPANSVAVNTVLSNLDKAIKTQSVFLDINNGQGVIDASYPSGTIFIVPEDIQDITITLPPIIDGYELTIKNTSFDRNVTIVTPDNITIDGYLNSYSFINPNTPKGSGKALNSVTLAGEINAGVYSTWLVKNQTLDGDRTVVLNPYDSGSPWSLNNVLTNIKQVTDAISLSITSVIQVTSTTYNLTYNPAVASGSVYKFTNNANVILNLGDTNTFPDGHVLRIKSFLSTPANSFLINAFSGDKIDDVTSFQLINNFLLPSISFQLDKTNKVWLIF